MKHLNGVYYTHPPAQTVQIGDPICPKCGEYFRKMVFVCDCTKQESLKWEALKRYLEEQLVEFGYFKECSTGVWTRAYNGILSKMKELETL
jgi:hypothetical protein